jgi:hypothetical protein
MPPDVIAQIMESMETLDDVFRLAATCRGFNHLIEMHVGRICNAVAIRSVSRLTIRLLVMSMQFRLGKEWRITNVVQAHHVQTCVKAVEKCIEQYCDRGHVKGLIAGVSCEKRAQSCRA